MQADIHVFCGVLSITEQLIWTFASKPIAVMPPQV